MDGYPKSSQDKRGCDNGSLAGSTLLYDQEDGGIWEVPVLVYDTVDAVSTSD